MEIEDNQLLLVDTCGLTDEQWAEELLPLLRNLKLEINEEKNA